MTAQDDTEKLETRWTYGLLVPLAIVFCVIACAGYLMYVGWSDFVNLLFTIVEASEHKAMRALVINTTLVVMIVCCLPGPAFCIILDGWYFGFWKGFALGFVAELIGYLICICLARTCLKARVRQQMLEVDSLREVVMVCEEDSTGKFLVLFRFISMPVWVKNYAIGMLDLEWLTTILVFLPAEIFYTGVFAYIGSKGAIIAAAIRAGDTEKALDSFSGVEVVIICVSMLCMVLIIVLGWREYFLRRDLAVAEGARGESAPFAGAAKPVV